MSNFYVFILVWIKHLGKASHFRHLPCRMMATNPTGNKANCLLSGGPFPEKLKENCAQLYEYLGRPGQDGG